MVEYGRSSDQEIVNADAGFHGLFEGGAVGNVLRIEDYDVGVRAFLQTSFVAGRGSGTLEHLRGHERHFAKRFHQGERLFLTDIFCENPGIGTCVAGMAFGSVAGDHD